MPQTDILIACANCGRPVHEADAEALGWRFYSDGVGELEPFCGLCVNREFRPDAPSARSSRRYVSVMARNVLIVSTVEHADDVLRAHVGAADTIKVVVPAVRQGVLDWLANDEQAFGRAERVAEHTAAALPGETVETGAGEANVGLAIRDALATFPADEIVVAVRPNQEEGLVESHATDSAPQHSLDGVPVRYVVIPD
jgi:hypothetical protein